MRLIKSIERKINPNVTSQDIKNFQIENDYPILNFKNRGNDMFGVVVEIFEVWKMSYDTTHTEDDCDKCHKRVGKANLKRNPFFYLDMNDNVHPDVSYKLGYPEEVGYREYFVCEECLKEIIKTL